MVYYSSRSDGWMSEREVFVFIQFRIFWFLDNLGHHFHTHELFSAIDHQIGTTSTRWILLDRSQPRRSESPLPPSLLRDFLSFNARFRLSTDVDCSPTTIFGSTSPSLGIATTRTQARPRLYSLQRLVSSVYRFSSRINSRYSVLQLPYGQSYDSEKINKHMKRKRDIEEKPLAIWSK